VIICFIQLVVGDQIQYNLHKRYEWIYSYEADSSLACAVRMFSNYLSTISRITVDRAGQQPDLFFFNHFEYHSDWHVIELPTGIASGLDIVHVSGGSQEFYIKLYEQNEGITALTSDLSAWRQYQHFLPHLKHSRTSSFLKVEKCTIRSGPENKQSETRLMVLSPKLSGISLHNLLSQLNLAPLDLLHQSNVYRGISIAGKALGELHRVSAELNGYKPVTQLHIGMFESLDALIVYRLSSLQEKSIQNFEDFAGFLFAIGAEVTETATQSLSTPAAKTALPNVKSCLHNDASTMNILVDLASGKAGFIDFTQLLFSMKDPLDNLEATFEQSEEQRVCEAHAAYDFFYLMVFLHVEMSDLLDMGIMEQWKTHLTSGYCQGWLGDDPDAIQKCSKRTTLWTESIELFYSLVVEIQLDIEVLIQLFDVYKQESVNQKGSP